MLLDIIIKSIVGGLIIGVVSTIAQKHPTIGAFIMGIPIVTFITLIIMYYSGVDFQTLKTFSFQTTTFVPNSDETIFREGQRSVVIFYTA